MVEAFRQFIVDHSLCVEHDKVLVAVSGGIDSVVLADLFTKAGTTIAIAHCNFKLRGKESDEDERFVKKLSVSYHVPYYCKSFDTERIADQEKSSIQETARNLRYQWFKDLAKKEGFAKIATGHHADDQVETFFINLLRGSGVKGLKGIPLKRDNIIRPLLFARRTEIEKYALKNQLNYREDSSNSSDKYTRNQIRHKLIPVIADIKPSNIESILTSISYLQQESDLIDELIDQKRNALFSKSKIGIKAKVAEFSSLSPQLIFKLLAVFEFNRETAESLYQSLQSGQSGKMLFSQTHQLLIDRDYLFIREKSHNNENAEYLVYEEVEFIDEPLNLSIDKIKNTSDFIFEKDNSTAYFDADKLTYPLKIRKWKKGDRFIPFGMKGSKLVSDFLIDNKVSRFQKENVWLLLSEETVLWIVGFRQSEEFKVNDRTRTIIKFRHFN